MTYESSKPENEPHRAFPVCVSINEKSLAEVKIALERFEFAEIRLDLCRLTGKETTELFSLGKNLMATCRKVKYGREEQRLDTLLTAIRAGAKFVDVETDPETGKPFRCTVAEQAKQCGCKLIISYHNYTNTPSVEKMVSTIRKCREQGADVVKFVTTANNQSDSARVLSLYDLCRDIPLVAFAMGEPGRVTRFACVPLGAPFTYAATADDKVSAPGQMSFDTMKAFLELHNHNRNKV